jgi:enoyl-CoA hydratase/carnithine racemase
VTDLLTLEREDDVFVLTLTNGDNRFNKDSVSAIAEALDEVEASTGPAGLVVTGTGKFFSNGLDTDWMMGPGMESGETMPMIADLHALFRRTLLAPYPTAAAVNGHVFAAAAMWSATFDFRVMREDRGYWCLPEVDLGMPFSKGMMALVRDRLPVMVSHRAVVTGDRFGGADCARLGIYEDAAPEDEVLPRAITYVRSHAHQRGDILGQIKANRHHDVAAALQAEADKK